MTLLDELGILTSRLDAIVYRHMLADYPPDRANTRGARWNPRGVGAIYTSFEPETALAEAEYHLSLQTPRPRVRRTLYRIHVQLSHVFDLRDPELLRRLRLMDDVIRSNDMSHCQKIGGNIANLGADGLLVPSVRYQTGTNLVIYPEQHNITFEVADKQIVEEAEP